ncbi:hypothetical protein ThrDRAFT_00059 [Frankia casuarinae]|nr:hypothetical protein ThrDRAFT_00059 [Frankia casuarinae]
MVPSRAIIEHMFGKDLETVPLPALETELCSWAGRLAAATCRWLILLAAFDRRKGWSASGMPTCAHWLSWRCGLGLRASYDYLRVARALELLPLIRESFSKGEISYSKVRAITRVAEPETEARWVEQAAQCTAQKLERLVSLHAKINHDQKDENGGRDEDGPNNTRCSWRWNEDGTFSLSVRLDPARGAIIESALVMAMSSLHDSRDSNREDSSTTSDAEGSINDTSITHAGPEMKADALTAMSESFLSTGAPTLMSSTSHTINVHIDIDTLIGSSRENHGSPLQRHEGNGLNTRRCDVKDHIPVLPNVVRRLSCDSLLRTLIIDSKGNPLMLGRTRRNPTTRLRLAIYARDRGVCQYPGCHHTRWLQVHHMKEWASGGGNTDLDNLVLICSLHHRTIHERRIVLQRGRDGSIVARHRDGTLMQQAPRLHLGPDLLELLSDNTSAAPAETVPTRRVA